MISLYSPAGYTVQTVPSGVTGPTGPTAPTGPTGPTGVPAPPGIITQFPLGPRPTGQTWPFVNPGSSKQCDMAYCPLNDSIYAQGGDTVGSATDGTYVAAAATPNVWRTLVGRPVFSTLPAPHALQDDFGFYWVPSRSKFVLWPGAYFAYDAAGTPILNYTGGFWWYDPIANVYTQDTRLFPNQPQGGVSPGITAGTTGCPYGGVYDPATDIAYVIGGDGGPQATIYRWDLINAIRLPNVGPFNIPKPPGITVNGANYFTRTRPTIINGKIYVLGYFTDGAALNITRFWCFDIGSHGWQEKSAPVSKITKDLEVQLNNSHGKVVWPNFTGPDGVIASMEIYDPAIDVWKQDTQTWPAGFMGNMTVSLPNGKIGLSGGVFGPQQTMFNYYEAA